MTGNFHREAMIELLLRDAIPSRGDANKLTVSGRHIIVVLLERIEVKE